MNRTIEWLLGLEPGQLAGADSWSPRFTAQYNNWLVLGMAVIFAALVALTVICYLREGDVRRRTKLIMAGIRLAIIVLVFALLLQPALVLKRKLNLYSAVAVVVDDSLSMSLKDKYADPETRRAVAAKLGVMPDELGQLSRTDIIKKVLARQGGPLAKLTEDHPLVIVKFSTAQPGQDAYTQPLAVVDVVSAPPQPGVKPTPPAKSIADAFSKLAAGGYETNLASALRDAADRLQGRRVAGIVLVSDGQATGGDAANRLTSALAYVRQRGIPVFAVGVGDPVPPQNVAVLQLQAPTEVRKGSTAELTAHVANRNCGGKTVEMRILRKPLNGEEWKDVAGQQVTLAGSDKPGQSEAQEVVFRVEADELGDYVYKALVKSFEGEFSPEDNAATANLRISDEKVKILLVSGHAGWEFQYLRNFILRSPDRFAVSVWQQDAEAQFNQEASSPDMRLTQLPRKKEELYKYDVIVLRDPAYTENGIDATFVDMLHEFVADHHGGLCFIAAIKNTETNLTSPGPFQPLAALLPVVLDRQTLNIAERITRGEPTAWQCQPTGIGLEHPVLRLGRDMKETQAVWSILPGVYWSHPVVRLKPLATALVVSGDPSRRTSEGSEQVPLVAVQYYGKGRALYLGTDETWRWRAVQDGAYHWKFWGNVLDFLAAGRLEKKRISIATGADRFSVGEEMRIQVTAYGRDYQPLEDETFTVELIDTATGKVEKIELQRDAKRKVKGQYEGTRLLKSVGRFELTARRDDPTWKDDVSGKSIVVTLPEEEFRHPESDPATLGTAAPDGRYVTVENSDKLAALVPPGKNTYTEERPHELWDVPLSLIVIVLLLAVEWVLRKKYNMA